MCVFVFVDQTAKMLETFSIFFLTPSIDNSTHFGRVVLYSCSDCILPFCAVLSRCLYSTKWR